MVHTCIYFFLQRALSQRRIRNNLPPPLRSGHHHIKDGECAESNEKLYFRFFRFSVFELLPKRYKKYKKATIQNRLQKKSFVQKWQNLQVIHLFTEIYFSIQACHE